MGRCWLSGKLSKEYIKYCLYDFCYCLWSTSHLKIVVFCFNCSVLVYFAKKEKKASWEAASSTAASVQRSRGKWGEKANFPSSQCHIAHITEAHQKNPDRKHVFSINSMNEYCRAMGVGWPGDCVFRKLESIPTALLPIFQVHHCLWWHSGSSMCPNLGNFNGFICSVFELVRTRLCFCTGRSLCFQRTQNPLCCFDVDDHLDPLPSALSPSAHHLAIHHCQLSEVSVTGGVLLQLSLMTLHCRDKH